MRIFIRTDIYYVTYVNNDVGYATCTKYSVINCGLYLIYRYYIGLSNKLSTRARYENSRFMADESADRFTISD